MKLGSFGRASQRSSRRVPAGDHLRDLVEVTGADESLVRDRAVAQFLRGELLLLEFRISGHARVRVPAREMEHRHVERVESSEGNKLELVAHFAQLLLEAGDAGFVEFLLPVERR